MTPESQGTGTGRRDQGRSQEADTMTMATCSIEGCGRPVVGRGWCNSHWKRWRTHGDPTAGRTAKGAPAAFLAQVIAGSAPVEANGCILWPYAVQEGYGMIFCKATGRQVTVGRKVLEHFAGPPPTRQHSMGHAPHEVCGHRHCIAPAHISWQTVEEQTEALIADGSLVKFSDAQVLDAIRRVRDGETKASVARSLGASEKVVRLWANGETRGHLAAQVDAQLRNVTKQPIPERQETA